MSFHKSNEESTALAYNPAAVVEEDGRNNNKRNGQTMYDWSKVKKHHNGCMSYLLQLILVASSGSFLFGISLSLMNTCIDYVGWELHWCHFATERIDVMSCTRAKNYKAFITTAVLLGAAIGSMTGGSFMSFGRRGMTLMSLALFFFATMSGVVSNSFAALLWARLLCGYAVGLISVCIPTYMSEVTPSAKRGFYGVFHQLFITVGILVGSLLGLPIALASPIPTIKDDYPLGGFIKEIPMFPKVWWRVMVGFTFIPVVLTGLLMGFKYTFETPHYYVEHGSPQDAAELLQRLTGKDDVTDELNQIVDDIRVAETAKAQGQGLGAAMRRADYRYVIIVGCLLSAFQQLGGINVFITSSNALFKDAGLKGKWPTIVSNLMNLVNCVMTLPAVPLIERMGRKSLLLMGCIGQTVFIAPAMICYWAKGSDADVTRYLAIVGCIGFIVFFAAAYGPILWVYLFEIYPTEIKSAAAGVATAVNWISGIVMVFLTNYLKNNVAFTVFFVMCLLSVLVVTVCMKETKGLPLGTSPFITRN